MGILLLLVGLMTLSMGLLGLRARRRQAAAVVLTVAGALTILAAGTGVPRVRPAAWTLVVLTLSVAAGSVLVTTLRVRRERLGRETSQGERLRAFVDNGQESAGREPRHQPRDGDV